MLIYVRERRVAMGLTQEALAARLGVDRAAVALWEGGRRTPTTDKLPALAEALDCDIGELFVPSHIKSDREKVE